jgi:hypothetical protein
MWQNLNNFDWQYWIKNCIHEANKPLKPKLVLVIFKFPVPTPKKTAPLHYKDQLAMVFTSRILMNTNMHAVGKTHAYWLLKLVVHTVVTGLWRVKSRLKSGNGCYDANQIFFVFPCSGLKHTDWNIQNCKFYLCIWRIIYMGNGLAFRIVCWL